MNIVPAKHQHVNIVTVSLLMLAFNPKLCCLSVEHTLTDLSPLLTVPAANWRLDCSSQQWMQSWSCKVVWMNVHQMDAIYFIARWTRVTCLSKTTLCLNTSCLLHPLCPHDEALGRWSERALMENLWKRLRESKQSFTECLHSVSLQTSDLITHTHTHTQ